MKLNLKQITFSISAAIWLVACSSSNIKEREISSEVRSGRSLLESANYFLQVGDLNTALQTYRKAYDLFTLVDDLEGKFHTSIGIIKTLIHSGKYDEALNLIKKLETTEIISKELSEQYKLTVVEYHFSKEEYDQVKNLTELTVIEQYSKNFQLIMMAYRLYSLSKLNEDYTYEKNILIESIKNIREKVTTLTESDLLDISFVYSALGYVFSKEEKWEKANSLFQNSLEIEKQMGNYRNIADNLFALGIVNKNLGKFDLAIDYFYRASEIYRILKNTSLSEKADVEKLFIKLQINQNDSDAINNLRKILSSTNDEQLREKIRNFIRIKK